MSTSDKWDQTVATAILSFKDFNVTQVNNLQLVQTLLFDNEAYLSIVSLIREKNWKALKTIPVNDRTGFKEFLDIIKFFDQNGQMHVVTIYDSEELWQEPQIVDIFFLH